MHTWSCSTGDTANMNFRADDDDGYGDDNHDIVVKVAVSVKIVVKKLEVV